MFGDFIIFLRCSSEVVVLFKNLMGTKIFVREKNYQEFRLVTVQFNLRSTHLNRGRRCKDVFIDQVRQDLGTRVRVFLFTGIIGIPDLRLMGSDSGTDLPPLDRAKNIR
jgi:hypothetical protein